MKKIILDTLEQDLKKLLEKMACGAQEKTVNLDGTDETVFLFDYDGMSKYISISKDILFTMLDHISIHDFEEEGAPMLESQLCDTIAGTFNSPSHREGFYKLFEELYDTEPTDFYSREKYAKEEQRRVEWYYGISRTFDEPFLKTQNKEHFILRQEELMDLCNAYTPAIALGLFYGKDFIDKQVRYLVLDDKPWYGYAPFGSYFFIDKKMYVITHDKKLWNFRSGYGERYLMEQADKGVAAKYYEQGPIDYVDDNGEVVTTEPCEASDIARRRFEKKGLFVAEVLFAGARTNIWLKNTKEYAFTGDAVTLKSLENDLHYTMGLSVDLHAHQYALIADNHDLPLPPDFKCEYYKVGSVFYDLEKMMHRIRVFGCCSAFAQSRLPWRVMMQQLKHSPCYAKEEEEWMAMDEKK